MKPDARRFGLLSLMAALAAPLLILLPRTAHPFDIGPALALPTLTLLAAGLAWRDQGAPLSRLWAWTLGSVGLAWPLFYLLTRNWALNLIRYDLGPHLPWLQRGTLALFALALALEAGRRVQGALDPWIRRLGLGLFAVACLAGARSLRPDEALRTLLLWAAYPLAFIAAYHWAGGRAERRRLLLLLVVVGALNAAYGVLQTLGLDPLPWNNGFNGRAIGFLGNPNFLGGHLALLLPLSLALALDERGTPRAQAWRWLLAAVLALGLLLSQTRGAWAGAAVGVGALLWMVARRAPGLLRRQRVPLLAGALLALVFGGLYLVTQPAVRARIASVLSGHDVEASRRGFLMHKSLQLIAQRPALGVGPGNFRLWFPSVEVRGLQPADLSRQPYVVSEHSHNDLLQMAADAGVAAALFWLALLLLLLRALWLGAGGGAAPARARPEALVGLGVLGGLIALNVHGLANFPFLILPTQASAWALAGLALRALPPQADEADGGAEALAPTPRGRHLGPRSSLAWLLLAVVAVSVVGARRLLKEQFWWMGAGELSLGHSELSSGILLRALDYDRSEDRLWNLHGQSEFDKGLIWNSIGSFREAVRLSPYDAEAGVRLGRACVENNLDPEAIKALSRVAEYAPNFIDLWEPLAAALYRQGKFEEAVKAYDWMLFFKVNEEAAYANKAAALGSLNRLPQALLVLKQAEMALPANGKIQINLAITYMKLGFKPQARAAWKEANRLTPSDPQVDRLRSVLQ